MRSWARFLVGMLFCAGLAACDSSALAPRSTGTLPQSRPSGLRPQLPANSAVPPQSLASYDLEVYYARVQADLLSQGLLRTDGGGPDTPITDTMLARNFERIALAEEYARGEGLKPSRGELGRVKKWVKPVRVSLEFGAHVPPDQKVTDRNLLTQYVDRLARITGHSVAMSDSTSNFHVMFMSEDDKADIAPRIRQIVPDVNPTALAVFDNLPREIHCLVIAFSDEPGGYAYGQAIAVIRSEHPELLRRSCIHEEVAQGLGLGNDSPEARPSIFNDDDEFALLTSMDEMLLKILYDPQLKPGMDAATAHPIVQDLAAQMTGGLGPS